MGTMSTIATIVVGIFIIYLGYLIGVKKMLPLIIGYSDKTFYGDKEKYAKRTGLLAIILGVLVLLMPLIVLIFGGVAEQIYKYIIGVYVVIMIIVTNYWRFRF
ncbi:hypothetical protein [Bacillus methanolicus]|uniref:Putative membrane protein n=1 Tax=Bacillus methanolicus (strain MGA3 / ATCC 53907) TaxID=796606 RepID=I3DTF6_BACMM|nr:hypothetical protein [Bacillus methanolicus]AIE61746.1 putative membrane protein [Bacillus methanolicus MGA3]EIJ77527.1 hypothetical protein MGA3_17557 [Bacillus methanolicus MGA3]